MFSNRTRWSLAPNALHRAFLARAGRPLLDLTVSTPTAAGLSFPNPEALRAALASPPVLEYHPSPFGTLAAREALTTWFSTHGLQTSPERLCLTASTSEAYAFLFKLLCNPGEMVLVPAPSYPLFDFLAELEGVALQTYPLRYDGEWHVDLAGLEAALRKASAPRAIVTIHPNNPTGSYLQPAELDAIAERCAQHGLALISDEVFYEHRLRDTARPAPRAATRTDCLSFSLGGLSKLVGLPQIKLGWIAVNGPKQLREEALARLEIVADTYLSVSTPAQLALPIALANADAAVHAIRDRLLTNLARLDAAIADSAWTRLRLDGGWAAVLRLPATRSSEGWALRFLSAADVLVQPGYFYGLGAEDTDAYVVLSLLCATTPFSAGVAAAVAATGSDAGAAVP